MFEIIGLLIATGIFFALAAVVSVLLATFTWLLTRKQPKATRTPLILAAILIPLASAAYIWLCVAVLPGKSLFGDISEPLPNGYVIEALGKMPDFADIKDAESAWRWPRLSQCIGKLAVDGTLVVGQYSHPFGSFNPNPNEPYFIFDTQSGSVAEFPTQSVLQSKLGHSITLEQVQFFRSPLAQTRRRVNKIIEFSPPFIALLLLAVFVWRSRTRIDNGPRNIYT